VRRVLLVAAVWAAVPSVAAAGDRGLLSALDAGLGPTGAASAAASAGAPSRVQTHYDRARDLQERIRAAAPFSPSCHALGGWAARYAAAEVAAAEGFDRLDPARARRERARAAVARSRLAAARARCRPSVARAAATVPALLEPRPGAVSFGTVVARAPAGTDTAEVYANGARAGAMVLRNGLARARLVGGSGRYVIEVRFRRGGAPHGRARSTGVWLLPATASAAVRGADLDPGWQQRVRDATAAFPGIAGVWVHDLASGRAASDNAAARFPAASTVKLGVLVAALRRAGPQPERSALFHDIRGIATWSSNLGANRLLRRIGGSGAAQTALARMGARSSTYTGPYIVATDRPPVGVRQAPPRVSGRVTTAYDMGVVLTTLHEAARGTPAALARTGMSVAQARLALGLLLSSEPVGDNRGLFRDTIGAATPAAQKHGWISSARHSAAVIYTSRGPVVVSVLTYRAGLSRGTAAALGRAVVSVATSGP
jgi:beta-lactamase class A